MKVHAILPSHLNEKYGKARFYLLRFAIQSLLNANCDKVRISISSDFYSYENLINMIDDLCIKYFLNEDKLIIKIRENPQSQFEHIYQTLKEINEDEKDEENNKDDEKDKDIWILFCDDDDLVSSKILRVYKESIKLNPELKTLFCKSFYDSSECYNPIVKTWEDVLQEADLNFFLSADHTGSFWNKEYLEECLNSKGFKKFHEKNKIMTDCYVRAWVHESKCRYMSDHLAFYRKTWRSFYLENIHQEMKIV